MTSAGFNHQPVPDLPLIVTAPSRISSNSTFAGCKKAHILFCTHEDDSSYHSSIPLQEADDSDNLFTVIGDAPLSVSDVEEADELFQPWTPAAEEQETTKTTTFIQTSQVETSLSGKFKVVCYFTNWAWYRPGMAKLMHFFFSLSIARKSLMCPGGQITVFSSGRYCSLRFLQAIL